MKAAAAIVGAVSVLLWRQRRFERAAIDAHRELIRDVEDAFRKGQRQWTRWGERLVKDVSREVHR